VVGKHRFDNFCLGRHCDCDTWMISYSACGTCVNNTELEAQFRNRSLPLCCGLNGTLSSDTHTCDNGVRLPDTLSDCNWRNKQTVEIIRDPQPEDIPDDVVCISRTRNNRRLYRGAVRCQDDCQGDACFSVCHLENYAFNPHPKSQKVVKSQVRSSFEPVRGMNATLIYGYPKNSPIKSCSLISRIFPEDSCKDSVTFQTNGSVTFLDSGRVLNYGEFCISYLAGDLSRGTYMITTCKEEDVEKKQAKFDFYYIILSISIVCLVATILIYF